MKANEFKTFLDRIEHAPLNDPIWSAGFAFMNLTKHQHRRVWVALDARSFEHETVHNKLGTFDGIKLPNGLILLKEMENCEVVKC